MHSHLSPVFQQCCTLNHPFDAKNQLALIMKILQGQYPPLVPPPEKGGSISYDMINLITWLLQKDPLYRPSIRDLLCEVCVLYMFVCGMHHVFRVV